MTKIRCFLGAKKMRFSSSSNLSPRFPESTQMMMHIYVDKKNFYKKFCRRKKIYVLGILSWRCVMTSDDGKDLIEILREDRNAVFRGICQKSGKTRIFAKRRKMTNFAKFGIFPKNGIFWVGTRLPPGIGVHHEETWLSCFSSRNSVGSLN